MIAWLRAKYFLHKFPISIAQLWKKGFRLLKYSSQRRSFKNWKHQHLFISWQLFMWSNMSCILSELILQLHPKHMWVWFLVGLLLHLNLIISIKINYHLDILYIIPLALLYITHYIHCDYFVNPNMMIYSETTNKANVNIRITQRNNGPRKWIRFGAVHLSM